MRGQKLALFLSSVLLLSGCALVGTQLDVNKLEREIESSLINQEIEIDYVECPSSMTGQTGDRWLCEAWDPYGFKLDISVEMTSSDGFVEWRVLY